MAWAKLAFDPFNYDYDDLPQEIKDNLAVIDAAKAEINAALAKVAGPGMKTLYSYKLDYAEGKRVFRICFYKSKGE